MYRVCVCAAFLLGACPTPVTAQVAASEHIVISADRLPDAESSAPFSVEVINAEELTRSPQLRLDDLLRAQVPGFSLFRRSSSRVANPTSQGVTLRNFGPNGAGRTLVLLDGIPINDPFAGYVLWNQVPPESAGNVLVNPGGGAGLFGNAAIGGTIFLTSRQPEEHSATTRGEAGTQDTYALSVGAGAVEGPLALSIFAERFSTGGYPILQDDQRGSVDNAASSDAVVIHAAANVKVASATSLRIQVRGFEEHRGNGTIYTQNASSGSDLNAAITTKFADEEAELRLAGYFQRRSFSSTFSSVNARRDVETPALNQFDVPAHAAGGSAVLAFRPGEEHRLTVGADYRWVEGETNELFRWTGSEFSRARRAGGQQEFLGLFAEDTWLLSSKTTVVGGLRLDQWQLFGGFREERDRATGDVILSSRFADRDGYALNGRLGARTDLAERLILRAAGYTGFRVPTLNELYRPFRVGNDVTEANAALEPERLLGGEAALEWQLSRVLRLTGTAFVNRLADAVGNVTIGVGPGTFEPGGFIPAGGVLRQRQNIDVVLAPGFDLGFEWYVAPTVLLKATYLFTQPTIVEAADPELEGNLLAQTPQHSVTAALEWKPTPKWTATAQARYQDRQFEDDQNSRELAPYTTVDAALFYEFSTRYSGGLQVENLFDTEVETGKSASGLVSIGAPRFISVRLRCSL